jgi:uncharacterized BrkB/YihY/UPF0761 family membrane protein
MLYLAFHALFAIAPLLAMVAAVAGLIFGRGVAQGQILRQLRALIGDAGATAVFTELYANLNRSRAALPLPKPAGCGISSVPGSCRSG